MKYKDLTLDQRISLKGEFKTNPACINYKAIQLINDIKSQDVPLNDALSDTETKHD